MKEYKTFSFLSKFLSACQNLISSDQVVLDIPHVEGFMFNTSCMYLMLFDITQDFNLVER